MLLWFYDEWGLTLDIIVVFEIKRLFTTVDPAEQEDYWDSMCW
jgi:hypothetical protein